MERPVPGKLSVKAQALLDGAKENAALLRTAADQDCLNYHVDAALCYNGEQNQIVTAAIMVTGSTKQNCNQVLGCVSKIIEDLKVEGLKAKISKHGVQIKGPVSSADFTNALVNKIVPEFPSIPADNMQEPVFPFLGR